MVLLPLFASPNTMMVPLSFLMPIFTSSLFTFFIIPMKLCFWKLCSTQTVSNSGGYFSQELFGISLDNQTVAAVLSIQVYWFKCAPSIQSLTMMALLAGYMVCNLRDHISQIIWYTDLHV
mmetsp:Transcript_649/g.1367  ORF Transcript_649/g.1367 Transcript_649/m.1367 type:complete len:120 (-) Transcript_649:157-516(-)